MKKLIFLLIITITALILTGCGRDLPPNHVNSLDDVRGKHIGVMAGTPSERLASELGSARAFSSSDELMYHLLAGTVDCVVMESSVASELVSGTRGVTTLSEPLVIYDLRFAIPRENDELLKRIDEALNTLRSNGTLRGLQQRYFAGRRYTYNAPDGVEQRNGTLTLAVPPDSPPFSVMDMYGEFSGLDIDVARAVCDLLGVELIIIRYDAWELVTAVRHGRADLALGWLPDEGDEGTIHISEPYAVAEHAVIIRRS